MVKAKGLELEETVAGADFKSAYLRQPDPAGNRVDEIAIPERPTNLEFGGSDRKTLFITTDADDGLMFQRRKEATFGYFDDPDTLNTKFTAHSRFAVGWANPLGVFGSVGAS